MKVIVNGKDNDVKDGTSIVMLLNQYSITGPMTIVEVNQQVIAKDSWDTSLLKDGDRVEIIQLMGGG